MTDFYCFYLANMAEIDIIHQPDQTSEMILNFDLSGNKFHVEAAPVFGYFQ